jgi:hypothetical protein
MGIANRDKDASEKQYSQSQVYGALATAVTSEILLLSHPAKLKSAWIAGKGLSGLPAYQIQARRWTADGVTVIPLGPAVALAVAFGVSGSSVEFSSSLTPLLTNDLLEVVSSVSNTAVTSLTVAVVLEALQDIKEEFGATE